MKAIHYKRSRRTICRMIDEIRGKLNCVQYSPGWDKGFAFMLLLKTDRRLIKTNLHDQNLCTAQKQRA